MIREQTRDSLLPESEAVKFGIRRLFTYMLNYWFGTYSPQVWSVYRELNRTNNFAEAWNKAFNVRCGNTAQNIWEFTSKNIYNIYINITFRNINT